MSSFVEERAVGELTALACETVFVNDLTVCLFILARIAGAEQDTTRAHASSCFILAGNVLSARSIPYAPVLRACRAQLTALLSAHNSRPLEAPAPAPAPVPPQIDARTPPTAHPRPETPQAPRANRIRMLPSSGWQINPRRLFAPIASDIWNMATSQPTVKVFKPSDFSPEQFLEQQGWQLDGPCAICMDPRWTGPLQDNVRHLSCEHASHWLHDTCLAAYIEHQFAVKGIQEVDIRMAERDENGSMLLSFEEEHIRRPGPFHCAHCRRRYDSYFAMCKFVGWVRSYYPNYESPCYRTIRLETARSLQEDNMRAIEGVLHDDVDVIDVDADDSNDGTFVAETEDESDAMPPVGYNLRNLIIRRRRVIAPQPPPSLPEYVEDSTE